MAWKGQVDVILLDFVKSFNKMPHHRLLYKLNYYGVQDSTLRWIESFLSQRKQSVWLDGTKSTEADVLSGVLQGTAIGPLLFLAYKTLRCQTVCGRLPPLLTFHVKPRPSPPPGRLICVGEMQRNLANEISSR